MTEGLIGFLVRNIKQVKFFEAMRLLEQFAKSWSMGEKSILQFKIANSHRFVRSVIECLEVNKHDIIAYIHISILLTKKRANFFSAASQVETEKDFMHYFMNRFIWLYYYAFKRSHIILPYTGQGDFDDFLECLLKNIIGIQPNDDIDFPYSVYRQYLTSLIHARYSIQALQYILSIHFCVPFKIRLCLGRWVRASSIQQCCLNVAKGKESVYLNRSYLGESVFLSGRWLKITIELSDNRYFMFLPGQKNFNFLIQFLKNYLPIIMDIVITLKLFSHALKNCRLFSKRIRNAYFLGWTVFFSRKTTQNNQKSLVCLRLI